MTKSEAIAFYGGKPSKLARALGVHPAAVTNWSERIPEGRQYQLEVITKGKLKADRKSAAA